MKEGKESFERGALGYLSRSRGQGTFKKGMGNFPEGTKKLEHGKMGCEFWMGKVQWETFNCGQLVRRPRAWGHNSLDIKYARNGSFHCT